MPMRSVTARWGFVPLLGLLCLALTACGAPAHAQTTLTPTATTNTKGAGQTSGGATPGIPPYTFPATWRNAPGLPNLQTANPATYAFAPSDGRIGYVCDSVKGHLYVTHDGGDTWRKWSISAFSGCASVFVDAHDASDLFVETRMTISPGSLWRSRDGGVSWVRLGAITGTNLALGWSQIAVVGSRLIGQVFVNQQGRLQNDLFASDDGGMTWRPFAQSLEQQDNALSGFAVINSAIYIIGAKFWRSLDGGATWSQIRVPGESLLATPAYGGKGGYLLAMTTSLVSSSNQTPLYDTTAWWSGDSGATWKQLPDLRGAEGGYLIGGEPVALAPDGSVIGTGQHALGDAPNDAGVFRIQPSVPASTWQPVAPSGTQVYAASETPAGVRLWSIGENVFNSYLKYVDAPR